MKENFWKSDKKDPLSIDLKETTKAVVKGALVLGIGLPILLGVSNIIGGNN